MSVVHSIQRIIRRGRDRVFLVQENEGGYEGILYSISRSDKNAHIVSRNKIKSLDQLGKKKFFSIPFDEIILALHPDHVTTIESSVTVSRVHPDTLITEGELDGLLFHALWSFLNRFRSLAAKKLNTTELDLVIANIAVFGVKLQGHAVFNPLDFSGKEIELFFRVSFISRSLLPSLEKISSRSYGGPIVVERGAILAEITGKPGVLFHIDAQRTNWYEMGNECGFRGSFGWGSQHIYDAFATLFGVSPDYTKKIIQRFSSHRISLRIQGVIEKVIRDEYKALREQGDESLRLEHHELLRGEERVMYFEDNTVAGLFNSDERYKIFNVEALSSELAQFPYVHPQYAYLNQLLRRRAKWLVPMNK